MLDEHKFSKWRKSNKVFIGFLLRFVAAFLILTLLYELYLYYTNKVGSLDLITYFISRGSFETAKALGVVDCQWSCFYDGCYVGREGKMVNIIEGCNGLRLAIVYSAYVIGIGGINFESLLQMIVGFIIVQFFIIRTFTENSVMETVCFCFSQTESMKDFNQEGRIIRDLNYCNYESYIMVE